MTDELRERLARSREIAERASVGGWYDVETLRGYLPLGDDGDPEHIAQASPARWLAMLDVIEAVQHEAAMHGRKWMQRAYPSIDAALARLDEKMGRSHDA